MKYLLIIFAMFIENTFAEDKFPIEITCEVYSSVVYLSLNETKEGSWYMPHETSKEIPFFPYKKGAGKKNPFKFYYKIKEGVLIIELGGSHVVMHRLTISRQTLAMISTLGDGRCYKGFIEINNQI